MPVKIQKTKKGYRVSTPGGVKAKGTTKAKAEAKVNLLRAVEHGWKPTGQPARSRQEEKHPTEKSIRKELEHARKMGMGKK